MPDAQQIVTYMASLTDEQLNLLITLIKAEQQKRVIVAARTAAEQEFDQS